MAHRAGTAGPSVGKEAVSCISLSRYGFLSGNGKAKPKPQWDGGVHVCQRACSATWGISQVTAWQSPLPAVPIFGHAPATHERALCIPALHPCPQGIPTPSDTLHTPMAQLTVHNLSPGILQGTLHCVLLGCPRSRGVLQPSSALLCGCLIINNRSFQPHSDVGSHR